MADSDILVIGTFALQKEQLPQQVIERFGDDIISLELDQFAQKRIEEMVSTSWIERHKISCLVAAGLVCCVFAIGHLFAQILFAIQVQKQLGNEKELLKQKINNLSGEIGTMVEAKSIQGQLFQSQLYDMQEQLNELKKENVGFQQQLYWTPTSQEKEETKVENDDENDPLSLHYWGNEDEEDFGE